MNQGEKIVFRDFHEAQAWFVLLFMTVIWIALIFGTSVIAFLIFSFLYYLLLINFFASVTFFENRFAKIIPFHFLKSRRAKVYYYQDIRKATLYYFSGPKVHNHFIKFELNTGKDFNQLIQEEDGKALKILTSLIDLRINVFVGNDTSFLKKINSTLKVIYGDEISGTEKFGEYHTFFYLKK